MLTINDLIQDEDTRRKYHDIKTMVGSSGMRSSIYDVNNICNLRCKGCFYFVYSIIVKINLSQGFHTWNHTTNFF